MKVILLILLSLVGITAVICGGILMAYPDGSVLQLQRGLLTNTPFKGFFIPGLILLLAVGITNCIAALLILLKSNNSYNWSIAAGVMISGWIIVQMMLIRTIDRMQFLYLGTGILILLLTYQLKGKWAV